MSRPAPFILILIIISALLGGCGTYNATKVQPLQTTASSNVDPKPQPQEEYQTYTNGRYGYSIEFPASWTRGEESQNGDGTILYVGNPDIDIRVYASFYMEDISEPYANIDKPGFQQQIIKTKSGEEASLILGKENGRVIYELIMIPKNIEYHFYSAIPEDFFRNNEETFLKVVKSFDTSVPGIEKGQ